MTGPKTRGFGVAICVAVIAVGGGSRRAFHRRDGAIDLRFVVEELLKD